MCYRGKSILIMFSGMKGSFTKEQFYVIYPLLSAAYIPGKKDHLM